MLRFLSFLMTLALGIIIAPVVLQVIREHQETHGQPIVSDLQDAVHQAAAALQSKLAVSRTESIGAVPAPTPVYSPAPQYTQPPAPSLQQNAATVGPDPADPPGPPDANGESWYSVHATMICNATFPVAGWRAGELTVTPGGVPKRTFVAGGFTADRPVIWAVVTPQNFERLRDGQPFYSVYQTGPIDKFHVMLQPGSYYLVFFQPRQAQRQFQLPTSAVGLVATAINGIMAHQPARVSGAMVESESYYTTSAEAQAMREQLQQPAQ